MNVIFIGGCIDGEEKFLDDDICVEGGNIHMPNRRGDNCVDIYKLTKREMTKGGYPYFEAHFEKSHPLEPFVGNKFEGEL